MAEVKRLLWRLAGAKIAKDGARSWISAPSKRRHVGWFIMRHTKKRQFKPKVMRSAMRSGVWPSGYWAYMGARWDLQFFWSFREAPATPDA